MIFKNIERKEHSHASVIIEFDEKEFDNAVQEAYVQSRKKIVVPGFRKGKASRKLIEGLYGRDFFYSDAIRACADDAYDFLYDSDEIHIAGTPVLADSDVSEDGVLALTFEMDLYPDVQLGAYKGIEVPFEDQEVDESVLDMELEDDRRKAGRLVDVERPVQMGDNIILDFQGYVDGKALKGAGAEGYTIEVGSHMFVPGFEEGLVGLEAGKPAEIKITFPEKYDPDIAGKEAVFNVTVKNIRELELPPLDDELAKDISDFDTLEEYREQLRKELIEDTNYMNESLFGVAAVSEAAKLAQADIPEGLISEFVTSELREYAERVGMPWNTDQRKILEYMKVHDREYVMRLRPEAETKAKIDAVLLAVAKAENLDPTEEEIEEHCKNLAERAGTELEDFKSRVIMKEVIGDMQRQKAMEFIRANAVKVPMPEEPPEEENTKSPEDAAKDSE